MAYTINAADSIKTTGSTSIDVNTDNNVIKLTTPHSELTVSYDNINLTSNSISLISNTSATSIPNLTTTNLTVDNLTATNLNVTGTLIVGDSTRGIVITRDGINVIGGAKVWGAVWN